MKSQRVEYELKLYTRQGVLNSIRIPSCTRNIVGLKNINIIDLRTVNPAGAPATHFPYLRKRKSEKKISYSSILKYYRNFLMCLKNIHLLCLIYSYKSQLLLEHLIQSCSIQHIFFIRQTLYCIRYIKEIYMLFETFTSQMYNA